MFLVPLVFSNCNAVSPAFDLEQPVPDADDYCRAVFNDGSRVMSDNGDVQRDKLREELATLREEAIASLERLMKFVGRRQPRSETPSSGVQKRKDQPQLSNKLLHS